MENKNIWTGNGNLHLRDAAPADGPFLLWLEEACMKDYAIALWGEWLQPATWDKIDLNSHQIIEAEGKAVGCIAITHSEQFLRVDKLYICPSSQNLGIGTNVLESVIKRARLLGLPIRLSVLTTNPALKFYLREGFSVAAETAERRTLAMTSHLQSGI